MQNTVSIMTHRGPPTMSVKSSSTLDPSTNATSRTIVRTGTAARLAGLAASTLRIWEHRYAVVSPPKSPSGQRTYSMADVQRLRLIKRLTLAGHAIGTIATLTRDELERLSSEPAASLKDKRVVVVGHAMARKLAGRVQPSGSLVFDDLEHAERSSGHQVSADVLVVHVTSLHALDSERVLALRDAMSVSTVFLVYSFGTQAAADSLRSAGTTVCREPMTGKELARLIAAAPDKPVAESRASHSPTAARLYSDQQLASLAEISTPVACECPRHLSEIVAMLVGFERYSAECVARSEADTTLHRYLHDVAGQARTMFEHALERVVIDEGLVI